MVNKSPLFQRRTAGVLLHPTSLPCSESYSRDAAAKTFGTLGKEAYAFVDFMAAAGFSIWQMLPTGPTQADMSPYQSISAHAGNPDLISLDWLAEKNWIDAGEVTTNESISRAEWRELAAASFYKQMDSNAELEQAFAAFRQVQAYWLDDFSLFSALRAEYQNTSWVDWPVAIRTRHDEALNQIRLTLKCKIDQVLFEQFAFFSQWDALKNYANEKGIYLFGDMPIFVGHDSADVWAQQHYFNLDDQGNPLTVAGVPPDYFSETGQHWGNPHYNWNQMQQDGFQWWLARLKTQLHLFDLIRIDHFRGFEAFWEIPADGEDARSGRWVKAPGEAFLQACFDAYPELPLVAENLGVITDEVEALRLQFNLPGMLVLQFGFDGNSNNPHLPHNHSRDEVIYTGTHDNDTTLGWFNKRSPEEQDRVRRFLGCTSADGIHWDLIRLAMSSVSDLAIIQLQDLLGLDTDARMNSPSQQLGNWGWRYDSNVLTDELRDRLRYMTEIYGRLPKPNHQTS